MVNVNRNQLPQQDLDRLLAQFDRTLAKLELSGVTIFLNELLGKEERLMVAKRLAAIILMNEGYSEYKTSRVLKLSPTTTGIIASNMRSGTYAGIISLLKKKKRNYLELLNSVENILHLGGILPRRYGLDRYRSL